MTYLYILIGLIILFACDRIFELWFAREEWREMVEESEWDQP